MMISDEFYSGLLIIVAVLGNWESRKVMSAAVEGHCRY
jgi:hypothetical protein